MKKKRPGKDRSNAKPKRLMVVLVAALILYTAAGATEDKSITTAKDTGYTHVPLEILAAEFKEIRKIKGHFAGGTWNDEVDHWEGRKHRLMLELGCRLAKGNYLKSDILRLLDPPDQTARKGHELYRRVSEQPGNDTLSNAPTEYLVYYWRGTHDFLFCACKGNTIVDCGWWYAYE